MPLKTLCVGFNIDAIEKFYGTGAYGQACYKFIFSAVPPSMLSGCRLFMGDSAHTISTGRRAKNICVIGIQSSDGKRLKQIRRRVARKDGFKKVRARKPFYICDGDPEHLVYDGVVEGGAVESKGYSWAAAAFNEVYKDEAPNKDTDTSAPPKKDAFETDDPNLKDYSGLLSKSDRELILSDVFEGIVLSFDALDDDGKNIVEHLKYILRSPALPIYNIDLFLIGLFIEKHVVAVVEFFEEEAGGDTDNLTFEGKMLVAGAVALHEIKEKIAEALGILPGGGDDFDEKR